MECPTPSAGFLLNNLKKPPEPESVAAFPDCY